MNNTSGESEQSDTELLVVMVGVAVNLLLSLYSIYSQNTHIMKCEHTLCCDKFEMSDSNSEVEVEVEAKYPDHILDSRARRVRRIHPV